MTRNSMRARGTLALALAGLIGGAVTAGEAGDTTTIKVLGKDRKAETVRFEGELAVGQSRGLYTDAGTPVTITRTEKGLSIETAERTVVVPDGDHDAMLAGHHGDGAHRVMVLKHGDHDVAHTAAHGEHKRVIVLKDVNVSGEPTALGELEALEELHELDELEGLGELETLAELDGLDLDSGDGKDKVVVIRRVHRDASGDAGTAADGTAQ